MTPTYQPSHWLGGDHSNQPPRANAIVRDVLIAAAIKELDWSWAPGEVESCWYGEYRIPPSPEECFEDVADAQLGALVEAGYLVVHESLQAERDDLRAQVAESQDWASRMTVDRDLFLRELLVAREKLAQAESVITDFRAARQEMPHG